MKLPRMRCIRGILCNTLLQFNWHIYAGCGHTVDGESADHTETTAATCAAAAYCEVCDSSYGTPDPNAHDLVHHDAKAPNCTEVGWNAYEACSHCSLSTYTELAAWGHWYDEWTPNANATHTAPCLRNCGHHKNVECTRFAYTMTLTDDQTAAFVLCHVCGEVDDGSQLALAEEVSAEAVTGRLPAGEVVVRMGALENGQTVMSVAFEYGGVLTQPTGQVKITLPAGLLDGYALCLLCEDGTETALTPDVQEEEASFVLDFTDAQSPVQVICLMPVAESGPVPGFRCGTPACDGSAKRA